MWWFLIIAVAVDAASFGPTSTTLTSEENVIEVNSPEDVAFLQKELDRITDEYVDAFVAAQSPHIRQKRDLEMYSNSTLVSDNSGVYRLSSVKPLFAVCSPTVGMKFIDIGNWTYTVCVRPTVGNVNASVFVGYLTDSGWQPLGSWYIPVDESHPEALPEDLAVFYENQILYILIADSENGDGIPLVKYDLRYHRTYVDHTVHNEYPTAVSVWKMKVDGRFHMAVANSAGNKDSHDLGTEIYVYYWTGTYFDKYTSVQAFDVKDIEPFHIHGTAYLAVANHQAGKGNFLVDSEIFKYNLNQEKWISYQKMRTYGAMDWEFFSLGENTGEEFFLAVANKFDARGDLVSDKMYSTVIYKFMKGIFVPFQCLETTSATSVSTFSNGSLFLLAVSSEDAVFLFQYDGWRFVKASIQYTQRTMSSGVVDLDFFRVKQMNYNLVLAVSNAATMFMNEASIFELGFVFENPLREWHDGSTEWCFNTLSALQQPSAAAPLQDIKNMFLVDQKEPIVIDGNLHFDGALETSKLTSPKFTDANSGNTYDSQVLDKFLQLQSRLEILKQRIERVGHVLSRSVTLHGNNKVTADLHFRDVQLVCDDAKCQTGNISTSFLNGEDVGNLKDNLVFMDEDQVITFPISIQSLEAEDVHVAGLINDIDMNNVVTKSGNHVITASKTLTNLVDANDIDVIGQVDGLTFSPYILLLRTGYQNITGKIVFSEIDTPWLTTDLLNGRDLNGFIQDVVLTQGYFEITGQKAFKDFTAPDLQMAQATYINGIDAMDLWIHTMWKDKDQTITVPMTFSSILVDKDLFVDGPVNGLYIPSQDLLFLNESATITAPQTIYENVFANNMKVTNSINRIKVNLETGELDILMKTGDQVISGQKSFDRIFLDNHSFVEGTVDGVDLSELYETSLQKNSLVNSSRQWIFNNIVVNGPLTVGGRVSGLNIGDIYNRALKLEDPELAFDSFVFEDVVTIDDLDSDDINGVDVTRDLVLVNEPQVITGVKTFNDIVLEEDALVLEHVNDIDLSFLNHTILRLGNQIITSKKVIAGNLRAKHLTVNGFVNGVDFRDVMTVGNGNLVTGTKTFKNVSFQDLVVDNLELGGFVNGINVNQMMEDTLTYDGQQTVTGTKTIRGALRIPSGSNLQTNSLNGVDLSDLYDDTVFIDDKQLVKGIKTFASPIVFNNLLVKGSVDGVSEWDMKYNWMFQGEDQVVEGQTTFVEPVVAGDISVYENINGINITRMADTIVKTNYPAIIKGTVIFENVISLADISLSGRIQGIDLSEEAVGKTEHIIITSGKTFSGDLVVGDLLVHGLIDGVSVQEICATALLTNKPNTLSFLDILGNVTFQKGSTVNGLVSGVDIKKLYEEAVKSEDETFVHGLKTFERLTIEGTLTVLGKFGGIDIDDLSRSYMSLTREQEIDSLMHFEELQMNGTLVAKSLYTEDQMVSNINITELSNTILKTTGEQTIEATQAFTDVIFQGNVIVGGKVNGLEVPNSLMQRDKENVILSPKIFQQDVLVLGDLRMGGGMAIQGVDLSEWYKSSVKKDSEKYEVSGLKNFANITVNDITVHGLVDGVKFSEDSLLLIYGDQVITGPKRIYGDVSIHGSLVVAGLINGTDLEDIADRAVRRDRNNTITGLKTFRRPLRLNALQSPSINGVLVQELYDKVNADLNFEPLQRQVEMLDGVITEMQIALDNQAILLQYYDGLQTVQSSGYTWLYVPTQDKEYLLLSNFEVSSDGCTTVDVFEYDSSKASFTQTIQRLISSFAVAMKHFQAWGYTFVVVANSRANPKCAQISIDSDSTGTADSSNSIYMYDRDNGTFLVFQTVKTRPVIDIATFTDGSMACIVFLEIYNSIVACAPDTIHDFAMHEQLHSYSGRKATISQIDGEIILAIASVDASSQSYKQCVDIYRWDRTAKAFGEPIQMVSSVHATSVLLMPMDHGNSYDLFLVISEGSVPQIENTPRLFIYKYDGRMFYKSQEIKDHGSFDYTVLPSGELILFVLDADHGKITIYEHKGASEFVKIDSISSGGAQTLHAFGRNYPGDQKNHYLALAGLHNSIPNSWDEPQRVRILKSKMKGMSSLTS